MRQLGLRLVFDPEIVSVYRPRPSLTALGRQFWWYGRWKARVRRAAPRLAPARGTSCPRRSSRRSPPRRPCCSSAARDKPVLVGAALYVRRGRGRGRCTPSPGHGTRTPLVLAVALPVMHASWGAGFLASLIEDKVIRR